jgi:hypothetical protein
MDGEAASDDGRIVRFVPSRVEGLPDVSEVVIRPDRLEVRSAGWWISFPFDGIARWPRPRRLWQFLARHGRRPRWLPVADRDWFHPPRDRFFVFYTDPPVKVFLTDEEKNLTYGETLFRRVEEVIEAGGFNTYDLG